MLRRLSRSKTATDAAVPSAKAHSSPSLSRRESKSPEQSGETQRSPKHQSSTSSALPSTSTATSADHTAASTSIFKSEASFISSRASLSSLRDSLPENPTIYDVSEIQAATNNFLAKRYSSSAPSWRSTLHGKDVIIIQRKFHKPTSPSTVREKLSFVCKSHHITVVKLLGASISGDFIYLVYEFISGSNLANCLRNPINPRFTVLSTWMSRMQIATDLANGLDYIHNNTGLEVRLVHNHIKASSIIVVDPSLNAKICHFGTSDLCGEPVEEREVSLPIKVAEISEISPKLMRSSSLKIQGTRGYMSPEFLLSGIGTEKSDVFAFGVVILELLSGEEPVRYRFDKATRDYIKISVIDSARAATEGGEGTLRRWIDARLNDSFPVDVAEKITRSALDCVQVEADKRPSMRRVAGKISRLYLESQIWADRMKLPTDFTASFAPR
ncbi:hypothetical protein Nepgr_012770 [Nepenthes gracilis]|uniref:Protein kinase domain-containing protein n=1 Tax=Nepenthes gracilis TaxID=150966 RepID=A0AAD3SHV2_NEPGR|nr:hypothetical protein Nepgr_012770 [Nepenthes gracilis]